MQTNNFLLSAKILTFIFILSISYFSINTPRAYAILGVGDVVIDPTNLIQNTVTAASAPTTAAASTAVAGTTAASLSWEVAGKNMLDYAAYTAAQQLLTQLSNNTIKWIQGGFHGSPSFAVDTRAIFTDIADNVAGGLVLAIRNVSVCNFTATYQDDLANAVSLSVAKRPYIYSQKAACPFQQNYGVKASDFYKDFSQGGWSMFSSALQDSGNPYGLQALTTQEQADREAQAIAQKNQQLSWSNGFTNIVDPTSCNYPPDIFYYENDDPTKGPLMTLAEASQKNADLLSDPARAKAMQDAYCQTTTPGKIVGDQLTKTLGLDMDRIGFADNMNKIVAAFLDTVTQKTIRGVFGTGNKSLSTNNSSGAGSTGAIPIVAVTAGSATSGLQPVTNITSTAATLNGYLTYNGSESAVHVWFVIGDTQDSVTPLTGSYVTGSGIYNTVAAGGMPVPITLPMSVIGQSFGKTLTGLNPNTVYWFSVNASTNQSVPQTNLHTTPISFRTLP